MQLTASGEISDDMHAHPLHCGGKLQSRSAIDRRSGETAQSKSVRCADKDVRLTGAQTRWEVAVLRVTLTGLGLRLSFPDIPCADSVLVFLVLELVLESGKLRVYLRL